MTVLSRSTTYHYLPMGVREQTPTLFDLVEDRSGGPSVPAANREVPVALDKHVDVWVEVFKTRVRFAPGPIFLW